MFKHSKIIIKKTRNLTVNLILHIPSVNLHTFNPQTIWVHDMSLTSYKNH